MAKIDNQGIWDKIQKSVQETERLMGQKKYNLSMIKARQTLEFMVKLQCDKAGIVESDMDTMIRELYGSKSISKSTAEHYLAILAIGNKASEEGDNSAYNANQAYHILSQETYAFVNADKSVRPQRKPSASRQPSSQSQGQAPRRSRQQQPSKSSGFSTNDLFKLLIPVVLIVILIILLKIFTPDKEPTQETLPSVPTTEAQAPETTPQETTEAPTEATPVTYKTTTTLNIRSGPSTDHDRIGKFDPDKTVEYLRDHDAEWAVILYNGAEAYVAKEYLTPVTE